MTVLGFFTNLVFNAVMAKQDDYARYTVRLPAELYQRVQAHAAENERSANAEIISLLELGVWEADQSRMERGLEPLREMTDDDREYLAYCLKILQNIEERKKNPPPREADLDVPFFVNGPTQREIFDKLIERLDRIENKLDGAPPTPRTPGDEDDARTARKNRP